MPRKRVAKSTKVSAPIMWMGLCVVLASVVVQTTRSGIDILALLIAGFILLLLERTVGDWVAESVGPAPTALIFALMAGICVAYVTTDSGRGRAGRLFAAAEARGYRAAYFRNPTVPDSASDRAREATVSIRRTADSAPSPTPSPTGTADGATAAPPAPTPPPQLFAATGVRLTRLTVSPEVAVTGQAIAIRANLSYDEPGVLPRVVFSVNGRIVGSTAPDAKGVAQVPWKTKVPGQYVVRAEFAGGLASASPLSAIINVIPDR